MVLKEEKENDNDGRDEPEANSANVESPVPEQNSEHEDREKGTLADELENRIDSALSGDVAPADSIEDAFLSD